MVTDGHNMYRIQKPLFMMLMSDPIRDAVRRISAEGFAKGGEQIIPSPLAS